MVKLLIRISLGIGIFVGAFVLLTSSGTNNLANKFQVAQAGSISSAAWSLSSKTLSQAAVKYTHTFTTATIIPANSGRVQIMLSSPGGDFGQFPDFKSVTLGSGTTAALLKQRIDFYPAGQGLVMVINNGGLGTPGTDIAAGTIKIELDGITNPSRGGVVQTETTTWSGPSQIDTAAKATIEFGSKVLSGKVTDASSGAAIADLPLELHGPNGFSRVSTDSNGNYSFIGVAAGTYYFEMGGFDPSSSAASTVSQYLRFDPEQITIDPNTPITKNKALAKSNKTITGTVKYADTKKPVVGAMTNAFSMGKGGYAFGQTGADGSFTLKVSPGDYFVQIMPAFGGPGPGQQGQPGQPQASKGAGSNLFGKLFKLTAAWAQQQPAGAQDFFPRPPMQVSFFKGATEEEVVNLGEVLVDRADATVKGKLVNPDGTAFKGSSGGGGMGAENMASFTHIPVQVGTDGTFTFKAKKNSGTWRLHMFDPAAVVSMPEVSFEIDEDTEDLGSIKLIALNKTITVTTKRADKGNVDQPVTDMPVMAFNDKNPGPPLVAFTDSSGVAKIKVFDGFEGIVMAMPGGEGGPGKRGDSGGASKAAFRLFEQVYAQEAAKAVGASDANRLYPITPPQRVKAGDSVTLKFDLANKAVTVKVVDSAGTAVAENGFVEARPAGSGFDGHAGGFGTPLTKGQATVYTPKGDFVFNVFFPPDSDYLCKEQKVTIGDDGATVTLKASKKTVTITGEVRDASNSNAVIKDSSLEIMVGLFGEGGFSMGRYNPSTGVYTAKWAPDIKVRIGVAAGDPGRGIKKGGYIPNINPKELVGKDGETITHHITLAKVDATIKGVVKDQDGKVVKGITVTADPGLHKLLKESGEVVPPGGPEEGPEFGFSAVTDGNGAYEINVAPNKYLMTLNARNKGLFQSKEVTVEIKSKETKENIDIALDKANATVDVEVESGATASVSALSAAKIHVFSDDGKTNFITETDSSGKASIKLPAGTYNFKAGKDSPEKGNSEGTPITKLTVNKDGKGSLKLKTTGKSGVLALPVTKEVSSSTTTTANAIKNGVEKASLNISSGALSSSGDSGSPILTMTPKDEEAPRTKTDTPLEGTGLSVSAVDSSGQQITNLNSTVTGSIAYDESKLPSGVKEDNLVVKVFDEASGQYKTVTFSAVDKVNNKVDFGTNHFSDFAIVATTDTTAPAAPSSGKAVDTTKGGEIKLTWVNPADTDFDHVNIYRSGSSGTLGDKVTATTSKTTVEYTNTGLTDGTTYFYTLRSVDTAGNESSNTDQVSAKPSKVATLPKTGQDPQTNWLINILAVLIGTLGLGLIVKSINQTVHARNH